MELEGKIKAVFEEKVLNGGFTKREFVVTTEERYPQHIMFELLKEKTSIIQGFNAGDSVRVSFDIRGREWNDKYFNSLVAWKVDRLGASAPPQADMPPPLPPIEDDPIADDLPF
jgi:hypothetical protein